MRQRFILLFVCLLGFSWAASGQNFAVDYLFNVSTETYQPLENDTALGSGSQDDILYMGPTTSSAQQCTGCSLTGTGFPIGFEFTFDGATFNRWAFSSNGYIKLGNGTFTIQNSLSSAFTSTGDSANMTNLIAGLHADIMMTSLQGSFRYRTIGNPGSRILVVEYRAMKHYNTLNPTSEEIYNFQIRLHEGSNKVSIAYGQFLKDENQRNYWVGIRGRAYNDFHLRQVTVANGNWLQSTKGATTSATCVANINSLPVRNTVFNFIPRRYDNDLTLEEILSPVSGVKSCPLSANEQVSIRVKNTGVLAQSAASIGFKAGSAAPITQAITFTPPLAPQASRDFVFTSTANLSGSQPTELKTWVYIPTEEEGSRNNDTVLASYSVGRPFESRLISKYDSLLLEGWSVGRGAAKPVGAYSLWTGSTTFGFNSTALLMRIDTPLVKHEWVYSPGYKVDTAFNYAINFQAAITAGLTGNAAIASIGDDTIKFMYSTDCQNTWKTMKVFNNADLTAGAISNSLKDFTVFLPSNVKEIVSFGFFGKNNGNTFSTDYRFHFRNFLVSRVPRFDLSADTVRLPSVVSSSCKYSTQEMVQIKVTNHGFDALDSTEAGFTINGGVPVKRKFAFTPPLAPGQSTWINFSGSAGADISSSQSYTVTGFTMLRKENVAQKNNDTARRSFTIIPPLTIPTPVYQTYATMLGSRWQRGRGAKVPIGIISSWGARTTFPDATIGLDYAATSSTMQEWFYSASYEGPSIVKFAFKAAVTAIGSTAAVSGMNQDTLKVLYSIDCGASWTLAKGFASSDLASGVIGNTLKEYVFELQNPRGAILVGFAGFRKATDPVSNGFTFHVDSVVLNSPAFFDMSSTGLVVGQNGVVTCPSASPVNLGVIVKNSGNDAIASATVGYTLNGTPFTKVVTFTPSLAVGASQTINFTGVDGPVFPTQGVYDLQGFVVLGAEGAGTRYNDSTSKTKFILYPKIAVPYMDQFTTYSSLLPIGWVSDTTTGKGFKISAGRGPGGDDALSFRAQPTASTANVITRNFGPILNGETFVNLSYKSVEQTGAFFRLRPTDFIHVDISGDCGANYTTIGIIDSLNQEVAPGFLNVSYPISAALIGQDITVKLNVKLTPKAFNISYFDVALFSIDAALPVGDLINPSEFVVYPNPSLSTQEIHIRSGSPLVSAYAIDALGRELSLKIRETGNGKYIVEGGFGSGIYTLVAQTAEGVKTSRLSILK